MINTSGQGKQAVVPDEVKGWSWGAFWLNAFWGASHKVYVSFLVFVPLIGFFVQIWLGMKGNEWAWQNKHWSSVTHFKRVQSNWARWGLIINIVIIAAAIALGVLSAIQEEEEAQAQAQENMAKPQASRPRSVDTREHVEATPATAPQAASSTIAHPETITETAPKPAKPNTTYTPPKAAPPQPAEHTLSPEEAAQILFRGNSLFNDTNNETKNK